MSAVLFQMRPATDVSMSNYHWQAAVSDLLHPGVRISMMEPCCQAVPFLLTAGFDTVKLSASKINFLKLMKMPFSFNLYFSSNGMFWGYRHTVLCHACVQPNLPSQQPARAVPASGCPAGRAGPGRARGVEEWQESSYKALGEKARESSALWNCVPTVTAWLTLMRCQPWCWWCNVGPL